LPDPRFFENLGPLTLGNIARLTGARAPADRASLAVRGVSILERAGSDEVAFLADARYGEALKATRAGACFVGETEARLAPSGCAVLIARFPQAAWAAAAGLLHRPRRTEGGAAIDPTAFLESEVEVGPGVVIGPEARIGAGSTIGPGVAIGPGVVVGRDCRIGAHAVIGFALVGDRVNIFAGAVIGEPGFGAAAGGAGIVDIPQLGRVILQDGVTIGANSCVDRGAFGDTVVGENTKIDNLVQIAHNAEIGRNCVMAAFTGISGSVVIGDGCQLGGRVGAIDHVTIGAGARIAASSGVMSHVPAGETWGGTPARPIRQWLRETATLTRLAGRKTHGGA
jgi:UDP-3-O-[3-hydroxymyristoyl] glucosamine N-acyltransferase